MLDQKKPHIALLFCGGTIGMVPDPETGALKPAQDGETLVQMVPGLEEHVTIDVFHLFNLDSSNMTPSHWEQTAAKIHELYDDFDGFVVAQGTDTMAYSASGVSFALQNLGKPVVFTGSIVPMSELGADGRNNLIYACLVAALDIAEVCIVFGNKIIRGNRAVKNHESFVDVFHSPNFPLLGEIERPIRLFDWVKRRHSGPLTYVPGYDSRIRLVTLFPGFQPETLMAMTSDDIRGIVIQGYGPGNIPVVDEQSLLPALHAAREAGIVVVITTQMEKSITNLHAYEAGYKALEAGVVSAGDMTTPTVMSKLMWALAQSTDVEEARELLERNIAGELTERA